MPPRLLVRGDEWRLTTTSARVISPSPSEVPHPRARNLWEERERGGQTDPGNLNGAPGIERACVTARPAAGHDEGCRWRARSCNDNLSFQHRSVRIRWLRRVAQRKQTRQVPCTSHGARSYLLAADSMLSFWYRLAADLGGFMSNA